MAALVSGHAWEAKKVSVTGDGRLREWFLQAATRVVKDRWPLMGAFPANNKHWNAKTFHCIKYFFGFSALCNAGIMAITVL